MIFLAPGIRVLSSLYALSSSLAWEEPESSQVGVLGVSLSASFNKLFNSFASFVVDHTVKVFFHSESLFAEFFMCIESLSTFSTISPCFLASSVASASSWSCSFFCSESYLFLFIPFNELFFIFGLRIALTRLWNSSLNNCKTLACASSTFKPLLYNSSFWTISAIRWMVWSYTVFSWPAVSLVLMTTR